MMGMGYGHSLSRIYSMELVGGVTESIFVKAEAWLLESADHQRGLEHLAEDDFELDYRSVMDMVFCGLFPQYQVHCAKFYRSKKGKPLRDLISVQEVALYDRVLLGALQAAYAAFCDDRRQSWGWVEVRQEAHRLLVA
jgi:hypothetical protein